MSHSSKIAVIVPCFNNASFIHKAIDSLLSQTLSPTIIVVENGSSDNSFEVLSAYGDRIVLIKNSKNLGFTGGVNVGLKYAIKHNFEAAALFNSDAVADNNWLRELFKELQSKPDVGIVTGKLILSPQNVIDSTGEFYSIWGMPFPRGRNKPISAYPNPEFVFGATGGASLYRCKMLKQIGLFDETFFAYYEDTDISFRAQLAGWKVFYTPKAIAYHNQGATSKKLPGFTVYQSFKNIPQLFIKNVPGRLLIPIGARLLIFYFLIFLNAIRKGSGVSAFRGWLAGVKIFWSHSIWARRSIQKQKRVSSKYISSFIRRGLPPNQRKS